MLLSVLRFDFIIMIRKHQQGIVRRRKVWIIAVLSQLPMTFFLFSPLFMSGIGGPIPILLIIGLYVDHKIGVEPPNVPWTVKETDSFDI